MDYSPFRSATGGQHVHVPLASANASPSGLFRSQPHSLRVQSPTLFSSSAAASTGAGPSAAGGRYSTSGLSDPYSVASRYERPASYGAPSYSSNYFSSSSAAPPPTTSLSLPSSPYLSRYGGAGTGAGAAIPGVGAPPPPSSFARDAGLMMYRSAASPVAPSGYTVPPHYQSAAAPAPPRNDYGAFIPLPSSTVPPNYLRPLPPNVGYGSSLLGSRAGGDLLYSSSSATTTTTTTTAAAPRAISAPLAPPPIQDFDFLSRRLSANNNNNNNVYPPPPIPPQLLQQTQQQQQQPQQQQQQQQAPPPPPPPVGPERSVDSFYPSSRRVSTDFPDNNNRLSFSSSSNRPSDLLPFDQTQQQQQQQQYPPLLSPPRMAPVYYRLPDGRTIQRGSLDGLLPSSSSAPPPPHSLRGLPEPPEYQAAPSPAPQPVSPRLRPVSSLGLARTSAGIGVVLTRTADGIAIVERILPGGAADRTGALLVNDVILEIDGRRVQTIESLSDAIIGAPGTVVDFVVVRPGFNGVRTIRITRTDIVAAAPSVLVATSSPPISSSSSTSSIIPLSSTTRILPLTSSLASTSVIPGRVLRRYDVLLGKWVEENPPAASPAPPAAAAAVKSPVKEMEKLGLEDEAAPICHKRKSIEIEPDDSDLEDDEDEEKKLQEDIRNNNRGSSNDLPNGINVNNNNTSNNNGHSNNNNNNSKNDVSLDLEEELRRFNVAGSVDPKEAAALDRYKLEALKDGEAIVANLQLPSSNRDRLESSLRQQNEVAAKNVNNDSREAAAIDRFRLEGRKASEISLEIPSTRKDLESSLRAMNEDTKAPTPSSKELEAIDRFRLEGLKTADVSLDAPLPPARKGLESALRELNEEKPRTPLDAKELEAIDRFRQVGLEATLASGSVTLDAPASTRDRLENSLRAKNETPLSTKIDPDALAWESYKQRIADEQIRSAAEHLQLRDPAAIAFKKVAESANVEAAPVNTDEAAQLDHYRQVANAQLSEADIALAPPKKKKGSQPAAAASSPSPAPLTPVAASPSFSSPSGEIRRSPRSADEKKPLRVLIVSECDSTFVVNLEGADYSVPRRTKGVAIKAPQSLPFVITVTKSGASDKSNSFEFSPSDDVRNVFITVTFEHGTYRLTPQLLPRNEPTPNNIKPDQIRRIK